MIIEKSAELTGSESNRCVQVDGKVCVCVDAMYVALRASPQPSSSGLLSHCCCYSIKYVWPSLEQKDFCLVVAAHSMLRSPHIISSMAQRMARNDSINHCITLNALMN